MSDGRGGRRIAALAVVVLCGVVLLTACQSRFAGLRLTIATGSTDGVYYQLGSQLADTWAGQLGIARPTVLETAGSLENIQRLRTGTADVAFGSADAVTDVDAGPRRLRALARIYDDYIQVVVRGTSISTLADLAGRQVSVGAVDSQTQLVANRILAAAGVHVVPVYESLNDSISALRAGRIDAFFWSGGIPTQSIATLARSVPLQLLDLGKDPSDVLATVQHNYPVYGTAVIPAGTYTPGSAAVQTLVVPNFLMVTDRMSDDVAEALVQGLFDATSQLVGVNTAALGIDIHTAIYTQPVPLHPGAEAYYRSAKV